MQLLRVVNKTKRKNMDFVNTLTSQIELDKSNIPRTLTLVASISNYYTRDMPSSCIYICPMVCAKLTSGTPTNAELCRARA